MWDLHGNEYQSCLAHLHPFLVYELLQKLVTSPLCFSLIKVITFANRVTLAHLAYVISDCIIQMSSITTHLDKNIVIFLK